MKILYISQYFHPEVGATTNRALANVRYLAKEGHDVTVLTEMPNHPKGIIFKGYTGKLFMTEKMEKFLVKRVLVFTSAKKNFITRMLFYISFAFWGSISAVVNWKKYDVVYVTSPPLFVGIIGLLLIFFYSKTKFIFEVRDLWPDAAIEMGELKSKHFRKFSFALEKQLYTKADKIIAVTQRFKDRIVAKGFNEEKICVIRNGSDMQFEKKAVLEELKMKYNPDNQFIVIYAGILGIAQNIKTILDAALILQKKEIRFILVGTGPEEKLLKDYSNGNIINNVVFTGQVPKDEISDYMSLADCGVIPLKNIPVFESTIPSKLFDYMSANLPILLGVRGEAKEILDDSKAGLGFEPDNAEDLAEKILYLSKNSIEINKMADRGRKFVDANFNRNKLASRLEKELLKVCNK
jgi:glycosyltransferase involved in cell wall biosynthesis